MLCFYNDDDDKKHSINPNVILYRTSFYKSTKLDNELALNVLVMPVFVTVDNYKVLQIAKMPGIERKQISHLSKYVEKLKKKGIKAVALFPKIDREKKSNEAKEAINPNRPKIPNKKKLKIERVCIIK